MNKQTEALKMAIEALQNNQVYDCEGKPMLAIEEANEKAIQACKEALEQEQSFAEKTAQMSFMGLWDAYTTLKMKLEALEQPAQEKEYYDLPDFKEWEKQRKQPAQEPVIEPTYYVKHPDGTFSEAIPQPSQEPPKVESFDIWARTNPQ